MGRVDSCCFFGSYPEGKLQRLFLKNDHQHVHKYLLLYFSEKLLYILRYFCDTLLHGPEFVRNYYFSFLFQIILIQVLVVTINIPSYEATENHLVLHFQMTNIAYCYRAYPIYTNSLKKLVNLFHIQGFRLLLRNSQIQNYIL